MENLTYSKKLLFPHKIEYKEFSFNGTIAILDVLTSMPFQINRITSDLLKLGLTHNKESLIRILLKKYSRRQINSAICQVESLRNKGFLLAKDEKGARIFKPEPCDSQMSLGWVYLNIVNGCNLRCRYCYRGFKNVKIKYDSMDKEIVRGSIDFALSHTGHQKDLMIQFFGGEPLLKFSLVKYATLYALRKAKLLGLNLSFKITTNATLLTPAIASFLTKYFKEIYVSIDGPKYIHDLQRPFAAGLGSYNKVKAGINLLLKCAPDKVTALINITSLNNNIEEIYNHAINLGIKNINLIFITYSPKKSFRLNKVNLTRLTKNFKQFIDNHCERENVFYREFVDLMNMGGKPYGCGLGRYRIAIDHKGQIFTCSKAQGVSLFKIGDIYRGFDEKASAYYAHRFVDRLPKCSQCWARYLCFGGCPYIKFAITENIEKPSKFHCRLYKNVIKYTILSYAHAKFSEKAFLN